MVAGEGDIPINVCDNTCDKDIFKSHSLICLCQIEMIVSRQHNGVDLQTSSAK